MSTPAPTMEQRIARLFGLTGDKWMRHANPLSVWTRFAVVPLIALAIWSRAWIGWYSLIPIALALTWIVFDPLSTIAGVLVTSLGKLWYIDRMVLLFEDVKHRNAEYAKWEY